MQLLNRLFPVGTRTLLYGAHQFLLHPFFLAIAWLKLYGIPPLNDWLPLVCCFVVHDWGYFGKNDLDGDVGQTHPELGGRIMARLFGQQWGDFTRLHSRYYAKREGREPSPLCAADKLVLLVTPRWIYLPMVQWTGEAEEYRALYARWLGVESVTLDEWYDGLRVFWRQEVRRLAPNHAHRLEGV